MLGGGSYSPTGSRGGVGRGGYDDFSDDNDNGNGNGNGVWCVANKNNADASSSVPKVLYVLVSR